MTTAEATTETTLDEEIAGMDREIERLEAERAELDAPARALTWDEIQAGAMEDLEARERRRGIVPRLIVAAKVKRLELHKAKWEREMEELAPVRDEAYARMEKAQAARVKAEEKEGLERAAWNRALYGVQGCEDRIKQADREIAELRGRGSRARRPRKLCGPALLRRAAREAPGGPALHVGGPHGARPPRDGGGPGQAGRGRRLVIGPAACKVCGHPERGVADRGLRSGQSPRSGVRRYAALNRKAVTRHRDEEHHEPERRAA